MRTVETKTLHKGVAGARHSFLPLPSAGDKLDVLMQVGGGGSGGGWGWRGWVGGRERGLHQGVEKVQTSPCSLEILVRRYSLVPESQCATPAAPALCRWWRASSGAGTV
jgi:hypothetical protein